MHIGGGSVVQKNSPLLCAAFCGPRLIASGELRDVAVEAKAVMDHDETSQILIFDDATGRPVEVDFRGSAEDVARRIDEASSRAPDKQPQQRGPGRPRLGVVSREVTLLPRHWDWLNGQPGGASAALRRLVEEARRANSAKDRVRGAQDVAFRFMSAMAGNETGFEEAVRALFAGNETRFAEMAAGWPADVRDYAKKLAAPAFEAAEG
jgi:hypothetical protein